MMTCETLKNLGGFQQQKWDQAISEPNLKRTILTFPTSSHQFQTTTYMRQKLFGLIHLGSEQSSLNKSNAQISVSIQDSD